VCSCCWATVGGAQGQGFGLNVYDAVSYGLGGWLCVGLGLYNILGFVCFVGVRSVR